MKMIKIVATGYGENSCEEIFLDSDLNLIKRISIQGVENASYIAVKDKYSYFVSEENSKLARIYYIKNSEIKSTTNLPTQGIVHLSFLGKNDTIICGSYTNGNVFLLSGEKINQKGKSIHCVEVDNENRYVYSVDIKEDKVLVYDLLNKSLVEEVNITLGSGPRFIKIYKDYLYVVTEYSNEIYVFLRNKNSGKLKFIFKCLSFSKKADVNYASAIDIYEDILAVSNRGADVITFFRILDNGMLDFLYEIDCAGIWPRHIKFYKDYLFVANERSNDICIFKINEGKFNFIKSIKKSGVNCIFTLEEEF